MAEQGPIDPRPEPKLPSREESLAWFNSLPPIPPGKIPEVLRDIDRLHREVFGRKYDQEKEDPDEQDWPLLRSIQEGLTPEDVGRFRQQMIDKQQPDNPDLTPGL